MVPVDAGISCSTLITKMKRARSSSPDRLSQLPRAGPSSAGTSPAVLEKQHQQQHQQQHVVRASTVIQQAQRCCSEISDGTLICCDSPDCVQDDDADTLTSVNDDCAECMNAVESGCTEDCVVVEDATQCQECVKDPPTPSEAVKDLKSSSQTQKSGHDRTLSATDAFDAEEPIKACDVPGCDASLEWDEKAMDELVGFFYRKAIRTPTYFFTLAPLLLQWFWNTSPPVFHHPVITCSSTLTFTFYWSSTSPTCTC